MEIINLSTYIQEGLFLHDDTFPFDLIVREKIPLEVKKGKHTHISLADVQYDFGISGKMSALTTEHKRVLLISETLNAMYLVPWLSALADDVQVTVLQLSAGIAGYMTKSAPDLTDIGTLLPYVHVKEVYDKDTLMNALREKGNQYIRIPSVETQSSLFPKALPTDGGIADVRSHGFEGMGGTIIAPGGVLISAIHAVQQLHTEDKFYDLFALVDYDFTIGKALKESIIKTENIIILLDQQRRTVYESIVKAKLRDSGLVDTNIHFVYPNTDSIKTILPEYLWEQANWDGEGIAEKITSIN